MSLWAFRFVLFYLTILLVQPQNRFPALWPFRIALVSMIIAIVLHVVSATQENRPVIRFGPATITALLVMAFSFISLHFGAFQTSSAWNPDIDIIFKNCICLILIEAMATTVERVWAVFGTIVLSTLWWIKGGLRLSGAGMVYAYDRLLSPSVSLIENPNSFAFMMAVMIPLYLYFYQNLQSRMLRWGMLACALSAVYIVLQTGSRTGLLCLICSGIAVLPKYGAKYKSTLILAGFVIFIITGTIGAMNVKRFETIVPSIRAFLGQVEQKDPSEMNQDELSAYERKMKNKHAWALLLQYPVFGVGVHHNDDLIPEQYEFAKGQVHNDWLYIGLQLGFIGIGLYASFMGTLLFSGRLIQRDLKDHWQALADLGWTIKIMWVVFLVGGFFSPIGWNPMLLAIVGATSALGLNYQNQSWNRASEKT